MEAKFFKNSGRRIKTLAKVCFIILIIASVVLAFVFGWAEESSYWGYTTYTYFYPERFFPILVGGPLYAWISSLLLYGFGELIENSKSAKDKASSIDEKLDKKSE